MLRPLATCEVNAPYAGKDKQLRTKTLYNISLLHAEHDTSFKRLSPFTVRITELCFDLDIFTLNLKEEAEYDATERLGKNFKCFRAPKILSR